MSDVEVLRKSLSLFGRRNVGRREAVVGRSIWPEENRRARSGLNSRRFQCRILSTCTWGFACVNAALS